MVGKLWVKRNKITKKKTSTKRETPVPVNGYSFSLHTHHYTFPLTVWGAHMCANPSFPSNSHACRVHRNSTKKKRSPPHIYFFFSFSLRSNNTENDQKFTGALLPLQSNTGRKSLGINFVVPLLSWNPFELNINGGNDSMNLPSRFDFHWGCEVYGFKKTTYLDLSLEWSARTDFILS